MRKESQGERKQRWGNGKRERGEVGCVYLERVVMGVDLETV